MKKLIIIGLFLFSVGVLANTETKPEAIEALQIADTVIVPIWAKIETQLKVNEVTQVSFIAGQIAEIDPKLLQGVTFNGFARKVSVEGQEIGQVLAVSVAKGDKEVAISATGLTAQFDALKTPELTSDTMLEVEGSRTELLTALQKLAEEDEVKDEEEEKERQPVEASEGYQSTGDGENDLASSYTTPSPVAWEEEANPVVVIETTTEGCEPRIDEAQGVVIETAKSYTLTDGVKSGETECSDTLTRYIIKEQSCENQIDIAGMKVYAQYKKSYVNSVGATFEISECTPDTENPMTLTEEEGSCTPLIDFAGNEVKFRTTLVYTNVTGAKAVARDCEVSETISPATLLESIEACSLKHDFANNKSYQMSLRYYEKDGESIPATSCTNTGVEYQQQKAYGVCPNIINTAGQTVTLQYMRQITVDGVPQYVSGCTPETTGTPIVGTAEGCSIAHDIQAGVSYQQKKYYYMQSGTQIWLPEGCINSEISYQHQLEIVGYENHDEQRFSYAKMKITINTPSGEQTVANNIILEGSPQIPYVYDRNSIVGTGVFEDSGCNRREQREQRDIYKRPDNSEYTMAGVPTSPSAWIDVCTVENQYKTYHKARLSDYANTLTMCGTAPCASTIRRTLKTGYGSGITSEYGWCASPPPTNPCFCVDNTDAVFTWEAYRVTEKRQIKTNPYTSQVFTGSWAEDSLVKECPNITNCPELNSARNTWISSGNPTAHSGSPRTTSWLNCSDYTP